MTFDVAIASGAGVSEGVGVTAADGDGVKVAVDISATTPCTISAGVFVTVGSAASVGDISATSWLWVAGNAAWVALVEFAAVDDLRSTISVANSSRSPATAMAGHSQPLPIYGSDFLADGIVSASTRGKAWLALVGVLAAGVGITRSRREVSCCIAPAC